MAIFQVEGGHRLHGEITPQGAKNEALEILCATLLTPERVVVHNIPRIIDVMQLIELLGRMGVRVEWLSEESCAFCAADLDFDYMRSEDYRNRCARLRGSVMLIGPMLGRFGKGFIPKPGGDKIGRRRLDTHFLGFQKLGAKFNFDIADEFFMVEGAELLKGEGIPVRVVSVPSEGLFRDQPKSYQQSVLPQGIARYGMTSGLPVTLLGLVGENGRIHGLDHFGYSAPYKVLDEKFGFNGQTVCEEVKQLLGKK